MNAAQRRKAKRRAWRKATQCEHCICGIEQGFEGDGSDDRTCVHCLGECWMPEGGRLYMDKLGNIFRRLPGVGII